MTTNPAQPTEPTEPEELDEPPLPEEPDEDDDDLEFDDEAAIGLLRSFGKQVQMLRKREGMSKEQLGKRIGYSISQIASIEIGRRVMQPHAIAKADRALNAGGVLLAMKDEVQRAGFPKFFRDARTYEEKAIELHIYASRAVPGLLQTEDYARAVLRMREPRPSEDIITQHTEARLARQNIFLRNPLPYMSFVLEEMILRRWFNNPAMMREQLERLLDYGERGVAGIQIMPTNCDVHAGLDGPFTLIETAGQRVGYVEVQGVSRIYTDRKRVRELELNYGAIRAQALSPSASVAFIEQLLGER